MGRLSFGCRDIDFVSCLSHDVIPGDEPFGFEKNAHHDRGCRQDRERLSPNRTNKVGQRGGNNDGHGLRIGTIGHEFLPCLQSEPPKQKERAAADQSERGDPAERFGKSRMPPIVWRGTRRVIGQYPVVIDGPLKSVPADGADEDMLIADEFARQCDVQVPDFDRRSGRAIDVQGCVVDELGQKDLRAVAQRDLPADALAPEMLTDIQLFLRVIEAVRRMVAETAQMLPRLAFFEGTVAYRAARDEQQYAARRVLHYAALDARAAHRFGRGDVAVLAPRHDGKSRRVFPDLQFVDHAPDSGLAAYSGSGS